MANNFNQSVIDEFRASAGRVGGNFQGSTLLLLKTTGKKSGEPRTTPLMYIADGERMIVIGSAAGADNHPAWFHNLMAKGRALVEVGTEELPVRAELLTGDEHQRLWEKLIAARPGFAEYQQRTSRKIPLVALSRDGDQERPD
ncbi:MAG: nitroreductase family deazaflavin-dependent oxidoreductase [Candidatus Dormibacteraeota bacterium]|nr:nitroreductase family deazaflavin-dependent oxidoreductase [Candidatus Dormibacteraeota bacterium]